LPHRLDLVRERATDVTSRAAPTVPISVFAAAASAQERWVETEAARLTCLDQSDRELIATQLKPAATRTAADWTARFAVHVSRFTLSSGLVFASVIGAALWATRIPSRHLAAATTAAAYLMIAVVALPVCWGQARRILDQLDRISARASRDFLVLYLAAMAAAALLYSIVNASAFKTTATSQEPALFYVIEFIAFVVVTAVGWLVAYLLTAYAYASALQKSAGSQALSWVEVLAAMAVPVRFPAAHTSVPAGNPRLDSALLGLLRCVASIDGLGNGQGLANSRSVRSVILDLELTAADMERYALERVPRSDTVTRRIARQDGVRLALPIRDAKAPLARAVRPSDYMTVAARLAGFLLAWADSGQNDLTTMTSGDASVGGMSAWQRVAKRIWNAVLLAAAAVVLPLLPIYNNDHAAAAGLRYALISAAVLSLVTRAGPVTDTIQRNIEGTLPDTRA
jgi:hypothetical protein